MLCLMGEQRTKGSLLVLCQLVSLFQLLTPTPPIAGNKISITLYFMNNFINYKGAFQYYDSQFPYFSSPHQSHLMQGMKDLLHCTTYIISLLYMKIHIIVDILQFIPFNKICKIQHWYKQTIISYIVNDFIIVCKKNDMSRL